VLKPVILEGSLVDIYPKYNLILNKPKIPFYQINKLSANIGRENLETHAVLV